MTKFLFLLLVLYLLGCSVWAAVESDDDSDDDDSDSNEQTEVVAGVFHEHTSRLLACDTSGVLMDLHFEGDRITGAKRLNTVSKNPRVFDDTYIQTGRANGIPCTGLVYDRDEGTAFMLFGTGLVPGAPNGGAYLVDPDLGTRASGAYKSFEFPLSAAVKGNDGAIYGVGVTTEGISFYRVDIQSGEQVRLAVLLRQAGEATDVGLVRGLVQHADGTWYILSVNTAGSVLWEVHLKMYEVSVAAKWDDVELGAVVRRGHHQSLWAVTAAALGEDNAQAFMLTKTKDATTGATSFTTAAAGSTGTRGLRGLAWVPPRQIADGFTLAPQASGANHILRCKAGLRATDELDQYRPTGFVEIHVNRHTRQVKVAASWDEDALAGPSAWAGIVGPQRMNDEYEANALLSVGVTLPATDSRVWPEEELSVLLNGWSVFVVKTSANPVAEIAGHIKCNYI